MATQKPTKPVPEPDSKKENNLLATLAHVSILAVFLGPFSMVIPLLIWLMERNKPDGSPYTTFQAKQAFFYQAAVYIISAVLGLLIAILSVIVIGLLFIPVLALFGVAALIYAVFAAIQTSQGKDFRYIILADFLEAGEGEKT